MSQTNDATSLMLSSGNHICSKCGKVCKDTRGLAIHEGKCGIVKNTTCEHCNTVLTAAKNLQRHYEVCKVLKEKNKQEEEEVFALKEEALKKELEEYKSLYMITKANYDTKCKEIEIYEIKLANERISKESTVKMCMADQHNLSQEVSRLNEMIKKQDAIYQEQKEQIKQLSRKNDITNANMIEFAKRASDKAGTTIYNNGQLSNNIQTTLQLQHFDGSLFRNKINPPSRMVFSISGLVDFLHRLGIGNCYRSVDRSRKAVMWIDQDGKEIRDSNCSQLREKLLTTMDGDIRKQLEYQQTQLEELETIHGNQYTDHMVSLSENIAFCKQLINRKASLMKDLQKELSTRAKNKNDTTIDVPRIVGHTKIIAKLEEKMLPNIHHWIGLSFEAFGRWIAIQLKEDIEIEGAMLFKDKKFIKLKNDEGILDVFYSTEFASLIRKIYNDAISIKAQTVYHPYLSLHTDLKHSEWETMLGWLNEEKEKSSEELLKGILLQKMNR